MCRLFNAIASPKKQWLQRPHERPERIVESLLVVRIS